MVFFIFFSLLYLFDRDPRTKGTISQLRDKLLECSVLKIIILLFWDTTRIKNLLFAGEKDLRVERSFGYAPNTTGQVIRLQ